MTALIENMLVLPLLIGMVFVITAIVTHRFRPKNINHLYGYRTPGSMLSQERWDFAQKYSTRRMLEAGIGQIFIAFAGVALPWDPETKLWIGLIPAVLACGYIIYRTEAGLRQQFPDSTP